MRILKNAVTTFSLLLMLVSGAAIAQVKSPDVHMIRLSVSNAYLLKTAKPVLIDTGGTSDMPALVEGLKAQGLRPQDITLAPQNLTARLLNRFSINPRFQSFEPDIVVKGELDLSAWGVPGKAVVMPGHTLGSLVVLLDGQQAVVGDIVLGGYLGGAIMPHRAGHHYFQADVRRNEDNIARLLKQGVETFYLGHGGPVTRESVVDAFPAAAASAALR